MQITKHAAQLIAVLTYLTLTACGGGSGGSGGGGDTGGNSSSTANASSSTSSSSSSAESSSSSSPEVSNYLITGAVSGLGGSGLVLQLNDFDGLPVDGNGDFAFPSSLDEGSEYVVRVLSQPNTPNQVCRIDEPEGVVSSSSVELAVTCSTVTYGIGGTVSGLAGSGLTLQNSLNDELAIDSNGEFAFSQPVEDGSDYSVTVSSQPVDLNQTCEVDEPAGVIEGADVDISVTCTTDMYDIRGTVSELVGSGLTLKDIAGEELVVDADGEFVFSSPLPDGSRYEVVVLVQPEDPNQTCELDSAEGVVNGADTDIVVTCSTNTYKLGGTVSGLSGSGLALQNNGDEELAINANGEFVFTQSLEDGSPYAVTVLSQPVNLSQTCQIDEAEGAIDGADVDVTVTCETNTYHVSGTVSGLAGSGLTLNNSDDETISIEAGGDFSFESALVDGGSYEVTIQSQPVAPNQTCELDGAAGIVNGANPEITVTCTTHEYNVGGAVSGLGGSGLILQNNETDDLEIAENGAFVFEAPLADHANYNVTVAKHPTGEACEVTNGVGSLDGMAVTDIEIECVDRPELAAVSGIMQVDLFWPASGPVDIVYSSDPDCDWENYTVCADAGILSGVSSGEVTLGAVVDGLDPDTGWYFSLFDDHGVRSEVRGARPAVAAFDGTVEEVERAGDKIYLSGDFRHLTLATGPGAMFDATSGNPVGSLPIISGSDGNVYSSYPRMSDARVYAAAPDGEGGWFIGGNFRYVADEPRRGLAHILPNGALDMKWSPRVSGVVEALTVVDGILYVGGDFYRADYVSREGVAAFNTETGVLISDWNPQLSSATVESLLVDDNTLYLGGYFQRASGDEPENVISVNLATGEPIADWSVEAGGPVSYHNQSVRSLALSGDTLYVGGRLPTDEPDEWEYLVAYDSASGVRLAWDSGVDNTVNDLALSGQMLFVGGGFDQAGGLEQAHFAAFNTATGDLDTAWNADVSAPVMAFSVTDDTLYLSGAFGVVGGQRRCGLASMDLVTGAVFDWNPGTTSGAHVLAFSDGTIYAGGSFTGAGGCTERSHFAALHAATGIPDNEWSPIVGGGSGPSINGLAVVEDTVYVGGSFTEIGGESKDSLAAFDADTGVLKDWDVEMSGGRYRIYDMEVYGETLYLAGGFNYVGGLFRRSIASINTNTKTVTSWDPGFAYFAYDIAVSGDAVYVGGADPNYDTRLYEGWLESISATTGEQLWTDPVNPRADAEIEHLAVSGSVLYAAGSFISKVDGEERSKLFAFDAVDGMLVSDWAPNVSGSIGALLADADRLYVGGSFSKINGVDHGNLVAFDTTSGEILSDWMPDLRGAVEALTIVDGVLYVAGDVSTANGFLRPGFVAIDATTGQPVW